MKKYRRLTRDDRLRIEALFNISHMRPSHIAAELGFHHTAILYELKRGYYQHRNSDWTNKLKYSAEMAQRRADFEKTSRGARLKIANDHHFVAVIEDLIIRRKLSPAAALATIRREKIPVKTTISVATLYKYIAQGLFLNLQTQSLPYGARRKKRTPKNPVAKTAPRGRSIDLRPPHVLTRSEFGHWEMDSVVGRNVKGETLLVFTERKTRYELILRSQDKSAASTVRALDRLESVFGDSFCSVFKSITCDNGSEFSAVDRMELSAGGNYRRTTLYHCHPYRSSERGSNENQNRIIRRFIKKGTPISHYSDAMIIETQNYLNRLPRRLFDWKTSEELFAAELSTLGINFFDIIL